MRSSRTWTLPRRRTRDPPHPKEARTSSRECPRPSRSQTSRPGDWAFSSAMKIDKNLLFSNHFGWQFNRHVRPLFRPIFRALSLPHQVQSRAAAYHSQGFEDKKGNSPNSHLQNLANDRPSRSVVYTVHKSLSRIPLGPFLGPF